MFVAMGNDVHREFRSNPRNMREQGWAGRVQVYTHPVDDTLHNAVEGVSKGGLIHVVLVQSHANRFGIDLDQLGERILSAAGDRYSPAQRDIQVRELLARQGRGRIDRGDRKSTRLNSSHLVISYA